MNPLNNHRQSLILGIILALVLAVLLGGWQPYLPGFPRAGFTSWRACSGSACSTTSTSPRPRPWRMPRQTRAAPGVRALPSTSPRGHCSGSAGRRCCHLARPGRGSWAAESGAMPSRSGRAVATIGIGAWLGTIMLLNVWGIIWPNQKKILGIKPATDEEKARARKAAGMASRVNFVLSIPMLMCMASQSHGLPFVSKCPSYQAISATRLRRPSPRISAGAMSPRALVPAAQRVRGRVITREAAVLCGVAWVDETFRRLDAAVQLSWHAADGAPLRAGEVIFEIAGPARAVLSGERTALKLPAAAQWHCDHHARLRRGGGRHRLPHPRYAQDRAGAAHRAESTPCAAAAPTTIAWDCSTRSSSRRTTSPPPARSPRRSRPPGSALPAVAVEVEVESLGELTQALDAHPDIVMLDEFTLDDLRAAVALNRARGTPVKLEASGSVSSRTSVRSPSPASTTSRSDHSPSTCARWTCRCDWSSAAAEAAVAAPAAAG